MKRRRLPKYCSEFADRHGQMRVRFRRKGRATYYFKSLPWTAEFFAEYRACLEGGAAPPIQPGASRTLPGTVSDLIARYYQSHLFTRLAAGTKPGYRSSIEQFRLEHGQKRVRMLQRQHIFRILGKMSDRPSAANNLFDRLNGLLAFAVDIGLRRDNPMTGMKPPFRPKGKGFHTWTEDEIAAFEARHLIGSSARLAMSLMLYTGQRRSDAVCLGRQHVQGGRIRLRQWKTGEAIDIPVHPKLDEIIAAVPAGQLTFLVTSFGRPFGANGFGNWFRDRCDEAGLPHCTAHGLRKAASRRMAEAGCTPHEIMAVTGHRTLSEVSRYTEAARRADLADAALRKVGGENGNRNG